MVDTEGCPRLAQYTNCQDANISKFYDNLEMRYVCEMPENIRDVPDSP